MKTMLKFKKLRSQFYGHGLLILSVPQFGTLKGEPVIMDPVLINGVISQQKSNNQFILKDTICLPFIVPDAELILAEQNSISLEEPKIVLNPKGKKFIVDYLKKNDEDLVLIKKRSSTPFRIIESIFRKNNLPTELKYLAVIESELKTNAVSRVGATGTWQMMPQTAKYLGLKMTAKYDERRHLTKSTQAAAKYLKILHQQFDDWLLVIAAYNSGAGPVYTAIKRSGSRDFWKLQHHLPAETRNHVKRFIGAHYYFENSGSEITLTKAEKTKYQKATEEYLAETKRIEDSSIIALNETGSEKILEKTIVINNTEINKEK
jgi:membrane-bound lytic murein transglycosylase D